MTTTTVTTIAHADAAQLDVRAPPRLCKGGNDTHRRLHGILRSSSLLDNRPAQRSMTAPTTSNVPLTRKQEAFCHALLAMDSAASAYRATYSAGSMRAGSVYVAASRLRGRAKITARLAELRAAETAKAAVTVWTVTEELRRAYDVAIAAGNASAAVSAAMAVARLHSLLPRRSAVGSPSAPRPGPPFWLLRRLDRVTADQMTTPPSGIYRKLGPICAAIDTRTQAVARADLID